MFMSRRRKSGDEGLEIAIFIHEVIIALSLLISIVCFYGIVKLIQNVNSFSRSFSDFFLYDFIGNWWGDTDECVLNIVKGCNDTFPVNDIFKIEVYIGDVKENKNE